MRRRAPWQGQGGPAQRVRKTGFVAGGGKLAYQVPGITRVGGRWGGRGVASRNRPPAFLTKNSGELKGMDTNLAITGPIIATVSTNADSFVLNAVEPGNGSYNRIGRKIFNKTVRLKGIATYTYADATTTEDLQGGVLRMIVVWDKQPTGVLPNYDAIVGRTDQGGIETSDVLDNLRYDNTARFQILRDTVIACNPMVNPAPTAGTGNRVFMRYPFDEFIDLKNRTTVFSGDSDPVTIADISSGGLYVYWRAQTSTNNIEDFAIDAESSSRLRFTS